MAKINKETQWVPDSEAEDTKDFDELEQACQSLLEAIHARNTAQEQIKQLRSCIVNLMIEHGISDCSAFFSGDNYRCERIDNAFKSKNLRRRKKKATKKAKKRLRKSTKKTKAAARKKKAKR